MGCQGGRDRVAYCTTDGAVSLLVVVAVLVAAACKLVFDDEAAGWMSARTDTYRFWFGCSLLALTGGAACFTGLLEVTGERSQNSLTITPARRASLALDNPLHVAHLRLERCDPGLGLEMGSSTHLLLLQLDGQHARFASVSSLRSEPTPIALFCRAGHELT